MSSDPDRPDFATRVVDAIKSAMGISGAPESQRTEQTDTIASPKLRAIFAGIAAITLALWGCSLVPAIQNWNNLREHGFSLVPGFYATISILPLGLMMLLVGSVGRGKYAHASRWASRSRS
jgi:hypothetical protein